MSCAPPALSLPVLYVLLSSKEQSGEKTNNGTHYKLQLLYSNGELILVLGPYVGPLKTLFLSS